ncbi:Cys/Met metabolism PLP-dependent enzyme-domain-containing protein [Boletus edulis BED1]|uniref:Cystathionine beta-lyase n=1 Tax=Boletus edulis BED1 TaxID=1328754 RepID=A0AAD4BY86_BOLED|nr:Cys/Met metabolism PLP-dependent enzyme-domain-containing protein [Boletus edulis BED1]
MAFAKSLDVARNVDLPTPEPDSPHGPRRPYRFSTLCANVENPDHKDQYGASSVPIYQTATFKGVGGEYDYSRSGNPTRTYLEHHIAKISSADHAFAVSSGMAALDSILRLLRPADAIIAGDDLYGGTNRLLSYLQHHQGITVYHVDTTDPSTLTPHLHPKNNIAMVLLESPTNPLLKIVDLATIAKDVKERCPDAIIVVDNTMMSPALQRPLEHGADIVYDSATKYLSGHHDLMAGVITCNRDDIAKKIAFTINATGNALTPFDSFLLLRGTKTLALRLTQQSQTASLVANYLHSLGFPTLYPGLPDHPNRDIHERISSGHGAVLSFTTGDKDVSERIVAGTRLWAVSVSFGCVNSLISMPCAMSHASIPAAVRAARGLPEDLIRLCVGIEDSTDLLDDLERALIDAGAIRRTPQGVERVRTTIDEAVAKLVLGNQISQGEDVELQPHERQWVVSSPGKVILFGEHAVVYGMPALAASVSLRCYAIATPHLSSRTVGVHFIDIEAGDKEGGFGYEWDIDNLPWGAVPVASQASEVPLDLEFLEEISRVALPEASGSPACQASLAFLYLYMVFVKELESTARPSFTLSVRATLPVGAGLGSSAAFSVCTATALMLITGRISLPSPSNPGPSSSRQQPDRLPKSLADAVNVYAFLSEKILHGNPSGVDNSVAVYGGGLLYTKSIPSEGKEGGIVSIEGFTSHRFLLTDTRVPRNTKELVGSVGKQKVEEPERVGKVLNDIQVVVEKASSVLSGSGGKESLAALIDENHRLLDRLRVSHPSLEAVRQITGADPYNLATKLTGAGGGGCAVTLIPDGFSSSKLTSLISALESEQFTSETFRAYLTEVGGLGLGILSRHSNTSGLPTPPTHESPTDSNTLDTTFASTSKAELRGWIEALGKWAYV